MLRWRRTNIPQAAPRLAAHVSAGILRRGRDPCIAHPPPRILTQTTPQATHLTPPHRRATISHHHRAAPLLILAHPPLIQVHPPLIQVHPLLIQVHPQPSQTTPLPIQTPTPRTLAPHQHTLQVPFTTMPMAPVHTRIRFMVVLHLGTAEFCYLLVDHRTFRTRPYTTDCKIAIVIVTVIAIETFRVKSQQVSAVQVALIVPNRVRICRVQGLQHLLPPVSMDPKAMQ